MRKTVLFLLVLLLTAGMVTLRYVMTKKQAAAPVSSGLSAEETAEMSLDGITENSVPFETAAPQTSVDEETASQNPTPIPTEAGNLLTDTAEMKAEGLSPAAAKPYTEKTYQLVSDLVYVCREEGPDEGRAKISALLEELESEDEALAKLWRGITEELAAVCADDGAAASLSDDLPEDDNLCFTVLGFQLLYDGDMAPELLGRCETALRALKQYPNAYVAVTGGGTAFGNRKATEADVMAEWFQEQGISPERIIVENRSMTTDQNAVNTCAILTTEYPQISRIAVITSDYHMPLGCMMFTEAALIHAWRTSGEVPYTVVGGPSWATAGNDEYSGARNIMSYVWVMANPTY